MSQWDGRCWRKSWGQRRALQLVSVHSFEHRRVGRLRTDGHPCGLASVDEVLLGLIGVVAADLSEELLDIVGILATDPLHVGGVVLSAAMSISNRADQKGRVDAYLTAARRQAGGAATVNWARATMARTIADFVFILIVVSELDGEVRGREGCSRIGGDAGKDRRVD